MRVAKVMNGTSGRLYEGCKDDEWDKWEVYEV